jgi:hypothetical protein
LAGFLAAFFTTLLVDFLVDFFAGVRFAAGFFEDADFLAAALLGTAFLTAFFTVFTADLVTFLVAFEAPPIMSFIFLSVDFAMLPP